MNNDATINQPSGNVTSALNVNAGTCNVSGNLVFTGTVASATRIGKVAVTSGTFSLTGTITWMANTVVESEVITVTTGTINFGSSITMGSASGTIAVTSTGTINFNGTSTPSLTFGGATSPVLTTTSGCSVRFEKGVTTVTTALALASGSNIYVGSPSSATNFTVDPGATVTNHGSTIVYGDLTSSSASTFVNGANATLELRGGVSANVTLTATATGNTVIYKAGGNQTVKATTYYNLTLDSTGTKTLGSGISVNNNLTVQGAAAISNSAAVTITGNFIYSSSASSTLGNNLTAYGVTLSSGTLNDGGNTITINNAYGWTNNGGTFTSTGTVAFSGTSPGFIAGSVSTTFKNLTMNNVGGVTLNVSPAAATFVSGALTLTNGIITTSASNVLKLTATATAGKGSVNSYINGPMIKTGNTDFTFPVGKAGRWMRVGTSGLTTPTTEITVEYFASPYADTSSKSGELKEVSQIEYWDVNRTVSSDPVKLKFYWEDASASSIHNCEYLTIAHYTGGMWQEEPATLSSGYCTEQSSGSISISGYVTSFSPFSFGATGGSALPIKLVSFDAAPKANVVETNWITSLEISNDYFTVERSKDGSNFTEVARITGAGNSTVSNTYRAVDENPLKGISYYRLRQTDFDGQYTYSNLVAVTMDEKAGFKLFPNPAQNEFYVNVSNPSGDIQMNVYDLAGRLVYGNTFPVNEGASNQTVSVTTADNLPSGVYFVNVSAKGTEFNEKLMVQ